MRPRLKTESFLKRKISLHSPSNRRLIIYSPDEYDSLPEPCKIIETLYLPQSLSLSPFFNDTIEKIKGRSILYLGLMLDLPNLKHLLEYLFDDANDIITEY